MSGDSRWVWYTKKSGQACLRNWKCLWLVYVQLMQLRIFPKEIIYPKRGWGCDARTLCWESSTERRAICLRCWLRVGLTIYVHCREIPEQQGYRCFKFWDTEGFHHRRMSVSMYFEFSFLTYLGDWQIDTFNQCMLQAAMSCGPIQR